MFWALGITRAHKRRQHLIQFTVFAQYNCVVYVIRFIFKYVLPAPYYYYYYYYYVFVVGAIFEILSHVDVCYFNRRLYEYIKSRKNMFA